MPSRHIAPSEISPRSLGEYRAFLSEEERLLLENLAAPLAGKRALFRVSRAEGGRFEVLDSLLSLLKGLGLLPELEIGGAEPALVEKGVSWEPFPSIDPLHPRNVALGKEESNAIAERFGIDPGLPLILQVGRFDRAKDPLGVIDAYRLVKEQVPDLQLVLAGFLPPDDREAWAYFNWTLRRAGEDFDAFVLTGQNGVGAREINAFQRVADVVVQKDLEESFSLAVLEAQWKGQPVIGGAFAPVTDGKTGVVVDSVEECALRIYELLKNPDEAWALGEMAREQVRENCLLPRLLEAALVFLNEKA